MSYFLESIKNIGLVEDCVNYPIVDIDLSFLKKDDPLGKNDLDLLDNFRKPARDYSNNDGVDCDPLYNTPFCFMKIRMVI